MRHVRILTVALLTLVACLIAAPVAAEAEVVETIRVSVASDGTQSDGYSEAARISGDESTIVYHSNAANLVPADTNSRHDVFAYDLATATTTRVSVHSNGTEANGPSFLPAISSDGSTIAYSSEASNLVPGDTNSSSDVFAYDVTPGTTTRISVDSNGNQADFGGFRAAISGDGSTIAYESTATNLVAGDTNGDYDVFAYDVTTGTTTRISVDSSGNQGNSYSWQPTISADGSIIAYTSDASNLVAGDTNGTFDVFAYDVTTGTTTRVSVDSNGNQANDQSSSPAISGDGSTITYVSQASNLVPGETNGTYDVFAYDVATGTTTLISIDSNGNSYAPAVSADGDTIAFSSDSSDLVESDTNGTYDVFAYDVTTGTTTRISVDSNDLQADGPSEGPSVSDGGATITYESDATNLVGDDTNGAYDVFVTRVNRSPSAVGFAKSLPEDQPVGTTVGTVVGSDPDGDVLLYAFAAGNGSGLFAIGTATGVVTVAKGLDYETAPSHTLTVSVSDGSLTDTATVTVTLTDVAEGPPPIIIDPDYDPFDDDNGSIFEDDIEWLSLSGITSGCGTRLFCPKLTVTRGQMAAFLNRALNLPAPTQDYFTDDDTSIFEDDINRLAQSGITKGCGPTSFCPNGNVTRGQMAAFLVRAFGYTDNGGGDLFDDDDNSIFEDDIDRLATAGVTIGCNPPANTNFCPLGNVTREQMAAFLRRALE